MKNFEKMYLRIICYKPFSSRIKAIKIIILCSFFFKSIGFSQSENRQLDLLVEKAEMFVRSAQIDSAKTYYLQAEGFSSNLTPKERVKVYLSEGHSLYRLMQHDEGLEKINLALGLISKHKLIEEQPTALWIQGLIYARKRENTLGLAACEQGMKMAASQKDEWVRGKCLACISGILRTYYDTPEYTQALTYYEEAKIIFERYQDTINLGYTLYVLVDMYRSDLFQGKYDDLVQKYYQQFTDIINIHKDDILKVRYAVTSGVLREIKGNNKEANQFYYEAIPISESLKMDQMTQHLYLRIAENLFTTKEWEEALDLVELAIAKHPEFTQDGFEKLHYQILKELGDYEKALKYAEKSITLLDSIYRKKQMTLVSEWETKYNVQEKEMALKEQLLQNKFLLIIILLTLVLAGISLRAYTIQLKAKRKLAKQKETIEKQSKELQQLDQMKSRFFANVSHELRTPLTLILGPLSKLIKSNTLSNQHFTLLKLMQHSGQDLLKLVNEILDLSKLEAGKLSIQEESVAFYPFFKRLSSVFESYAQKKELELTVEYKAAANLQVKLDKNKFEKIFNNLLSNALKFTPNKGWVTIILEDLQHSLVLKIADSGRGIHPEDLPNIFNRFYQTKQPRDTAEGGTGIGLALVNEYVKLFKGTIQVESQVGKGSQFIFQFPKKELIKTLSSEDALLISALSNEKEVMTSPLPSPTSEVTVSPSSEIVEIETKTTILYVEDNQSLRDYVQIILGDTYKIIMAENGIKALEYLGESDQLPALILSDVMMPIMDGFQLLNELKSNVSYHSIPVIMLTARAEMADKLKALRIGVDDYLHKPFVEEELIARIENLLNYTTKRQLFNVKDSITNLQDDATDPIMNMGISNQLWLKEQESLLHQYLKDSRFNINFWSAQIAMSERQLQRKLKQLTGLTPKQYLQEFRLNQARQLLENGTHDSVAEIAYALGYATVQTFSRNYKKRFGKLPSDYFNAYITPSSKYPQGSS